MSLGLWTSYSEWQMARLADVWKNKQIFLICSIRSRTCNKMLFCVVNDLIISYICGVLSPRECRRVMDLGRNSSDIRNRFFSEVVRM